MGLREIIAEKKIAKSPEVMMPLMFDEVYKRIKSLTDAKFNDYEADLKQKTKELARDLTIYCATLTAEIQKTEQTAIETVKKAGNRVQIDFTTEVMAIREQTNLQVAKLSEKLVKEIDSLAARIETMRGPQGVPGPKGNDGSPDTAEEVVTKVNKAKGVKIEAIDGLEEELKKVKKATGGGSKSGGGMGNVYHETKNVSSGTTSVTTTYPIAAGGRACWLYFQGQFLVYGTHYTVSGKNITLTFDKIDGTFIDITYIRG